MTTQIRTYAEMLREAGDEMPGEDPSRYIETPSKSTNTRKRKVASAHTPTTSRTTHSKRTKTDIEMKELGPPPGFRKQPAANNQNDETYSFLLSFVSDLNLQPFVTQIIVKFVIPIVHKFITNITNTVMEKVVNNGQ